MGIWPRPKPKPPASRVIAVNVPDVLLADVRLDDEDSFPKNRDNDNRYAFTVPAQREIFNVHIRALGYEDWDRVVNIPLRKTDLIVSDTWPNPEGPNEIIISGMKSSRPFPAESGWLHIDDVAFRDQHNQLWQWRSATSFLLFYRFLIGENIQPVIDEWVGLGYNMVRVLGMVDWAHRPEMAGGKFWPQNIPDYYDRLPEFVELLARNGIRCSFVVFADAQIVMPNQGQQDIHALKVYDALSRSWNMLIEWCNEPFKNIDGDAPRAAQIGRRYRGKSPLLMASGAGIGDIASEDWETLSNLTLDYCTLHTPRGSEWVRKVKDTLEIQNEIDRLCVDDEHTGADEESTSSGSRSNVPDDFAYAAGTLALQTCGGTFHSTDGNNATLLRPITKQCALAYREALTWVGPEAQNGQYTAGHLHHCPIEHSDDLSLRTFGSLMGHQAKVVVIRPKTNWRPIVKSGWRIVEQTGPHGSRILLERV